MLLRELFEQSNKIAVIAFGRLNPPTTGHAKLVEKILSFKGNHYLFLSHTQKPKTDPLDFDTKQKFAQQFFPNITIGHQSVRTPVQALEYLQGQGYTDVIFVAGSDRVEGFQKLFDTYNGQPDKTGKIPFKFDSIRVVSAGERDPDSDDVSGMSASKMRLAAAEGNLQAFAQGVPDQRLAKTMFDAVRKGMGITESLSENQEITPVLLNKLEQYVDRLFATLGIDVEFTRHFLDRVNDPRNVKPITIQELAMLFKKTYSKWGKKIAQLGPDAQAVIKDMSTDINMPFVLNWDPRNQELDLVAKTVMRKKNFTTSNPEFTVETVDIDAIYAEIAKEHLLLNPELYENDEDYHNLKNFLEFHKTRTPIIGNSYVYASIQSMPAMKLIIIARFSQPHTLNKIDSEYAYFQIDDSVKRYPRSGTIHGDAFTQIYFFESLKDLEKFSMMLKIKFSDYKQNNKILDKSQATENFADGKNPGRKGLAKRSGVNTKASVSSLRKTAKNSSGEKQRMAHWLANMKAGRAKNK